MKKKSTALIVWSILAILGVIIALGTLAFWGVRDITIVVSGLSNMGISNLLVPLTYLFSENGILGLITNFEVGKVLYAAILICVIVVVAIVMIITSIVIGAKRHRPGVAIWSVILVLLVAFVGIWGTGYYVQNAADGNRIAALDTNSIMGNIILGGQYFQIMIGAHEDYDIVTTILFDATLVGFLLALVSIIGYWFAVLRCKAVVVETEATEETPIPQQVTYETGVFAKDETPTATIMAVAPAKETEEETAVTEEVPAEEATEETPAEEAKPRKKVVLILKRYDAFKDKPCEPACERREEKYPHEPLEVKPLTREDVRQILKEELSARDTEKRGGDKIDINFYGGDPFQEEEVEAIEEPISVTESDKATEKEEEPLIPTPVIIAIPEAVSNECCTKAQKAPKEEKETLDRETVTAIIREEFKKIFDEYVKNLEPEVVEETVEEVKEVEVPVQTIVKEVIKEVEKPVEVVKEPDVIKVAPVVVEEPTEETNKPKVERIPFATRIQEADSDLKDTYNQLKSLLVSYGLKSRVSNGGDTFRLHATTYCKITVSGKSLKLYLALDPEDYKHTTLPIKDASSKAIYADIPLVFKVKSGLSLRRAESLIADMMDKHQIDQIDRVEVKDYASTIATEEEGGDDDLDDAE